MVTVPADAMELSAKTERTSRKLGVFTGRFTGRYLRFVMFRTLFTSEKLHATSHFLLRGSYAAWVTPLPFCKPLGAELW